MKRVFPRLLLSMLMLLASPASSRSFTLSDFDESILQPAPAGQQAEIPMSDINPRALDLAMKGYYNLKRQGLLRREGILTLIDFDKPSVSERLYVIDVDNNRVLRSALVAHGKGSGEVMASRFSNRPGSNTSSLGLFLTESTYDGKNGLSLVLKGLEHGVNDNAESRGIVIHGADYVSETYISRYGRLGRSQGCPAISFDNCQQLIDTIKDGSCLFIYHTGNAYVASKSVSRRHKASIRSAARAGRHSRRA